MENKKTALQRTIEELYTLKWNREVDIKEILRVLYIEKNMPQSEIAKELRVGVGTVNQWLKDCGIGAKRMFWL